MELTVPLHQVRNIIRSNLPTPSKSSSSRTHSSSTSNKIRLDLSEWVRILSTPVNTKKLARDRIEKVLNFFIDIAAANALAVTPAVQSLRDALSSLRRGGDFTREAAQKHWRDRIAQLREAKTDHDPISSFRNLCLQGFPIFNIWDSMSFIYTLCAEDIKTQIGAEMHLYQFRIILQATLRNCKTYFPRFAGPTTVAASWKVETKNQPLSIAFASTAVGAREADDAKEVMAATRREFMETITNALKNQPKVNNRYAPNREGNCPEFMVWPTVCRYEGQYKSLCLNMAEEWAYRCYGHCERTLQKLGANDIKIDDLWKTANLSTEEGSDKLPYPYRELVSQVSILKACKDLKTV